MYDRVLPKFLSSINAEQSDSMDTLCGRLLVASPSVLGFSRFKTLPARTATVQMEISCSAGSLLVQLEFLIPNSARLPACIDASSSVSRTFSLQGFYVVQKIVAVADLG